MEKTLKLHREFEEVIEDDILLAKEIIAQCKAPNLMVYYSWGASNFQVLYTSEQSRSKEVTIAFKVNGMKKKGIILVRYNWADYYEVCFTSEKGYRDLIVGRDTNVEFIADEVFFTDLQRIIDEAVEKQPEYAF